MARFGSVFLAVTIVSGIQAAQTVPLRIAVTVTAADGATVPVARHALLISDDPVTTSPHRFVTTSDGTVEAYLRPGAYIVESDAPFVFAGKAYQWVQPVTVRASGTALVLTSANATIEAVNPGTADSPATAEAAAERAEAALLAEWQDSVVSIWTPTAVGRGFLADARGLIATNQRLIGRNATVEVQLSGTKKVGGVVVENDANRNVAIVRIDPRAVSSTKPMRLGYVQPQNAEIPQHDKVYAIEGRPGEPKSLASGTVDRVTAHAVSSDVRLGRDDAGAPLFNRTGAVVGITTAEAGDPPMIDELSPLSVRIDDARAALDDAEKKLQATPPPAPTLLPIEPASPYPGKALDAAAKTLAGKAAAYTVSAADFDVSFITPPMLYAAIHKSADPDRFDYARDDPQRQPVLRPLDDFGTWNEYVRDTPPVVFVRVTPKFGEKFWTTVARGAAQTQGVMIPAIKKPKAAFGSLQLACGDIDVAAIHPLRIEHRVDDGTSIDEGLYVFEPTAISPACGAVKITIFSDKPSDKRDTKTIDAKIVQQVWDDFAPYRATSR